MRRVMSKDVNKIILIKETEPILGKPFKIKRAEMRIPIKSGKKDRDNVERIYLK